MGIFDAETQTERSKVNKYFESKVKAPYVYSQVSTLGGVNRAAVIVKISLDPKSKWYNGILHNSRYFMIRLDRNGTMEQFQKSYQITKKLRKSKVKSIADAVLKINKYISQVK